MINEIHGALRQIRAAQASLEGALQAIGEHGTGKGWLRTALEESKQALQMAEPPLRNVLRRISGAQLDDSPPGRPAEDKPVSAVVV